MKNTLHCRLRAFREVSHQFMEREARPSFLVELLLFVLIGAISAWPIVSATEALSRSIR
jgi:hypothetical protein